MIATIVRKELHQHWHAFALLALLTFGAMAMVGVASQAHGIAGSLFEGLRLILATLIPLAALVVGHRLVALEFRQKTQLFLEALPIARSQMVAAKYIFGFLIVLFLAGGAYLISAILARAHEVLTPRFLLILASRTATWTWFVYSLLFLCGFLGRYRFVFGLAIGIGLISLDSLTGIRLSEWGPFALIDGRFAFENTTFPIAALRITACLALLCTGLSFALGLVREGSVAALLGEKMSHREKMFCVGLILGALGLLGTAEEQAAKQPYDLPGAIEEARGTVTVKVSAEAKDRGSKLAGRIADELAELREYIGSDDLPPVFMIPRADFRPEQFERVVLEKETGVVLQANLEAADFPEEKFRVWLVREVLKARSFERAGREPSKWVLDGFALFWGSRAHALEPPGIDPPLATAARRGGEKFTRADVDRWLTFEKRVGPGEAQAVAWAGVRALARRHGLDRCRAFIRAVLGQNVPQDARATWHDKTDPVARRLERTAGVSLDTFFAEWREEIGAG